MSVRFLLDTNIVSAVFRAEPDAPVLARIAAHDGQIAIAVITWHELVFGVTSLPPSRRRNDLERFLAQTVIPSFAILDYGRRAAEWHAVERARLRAAGTPAPMADSQIAAIAATERLSLVTHNTRDFQVFSDLQVEDWLG